MTYHDDAPRVTVNNHQHDNYLSEDSCLTFIIPFTSLIFNDNIFKCKSIEYYVLKDHSGVNKCNSEALCSLPSTEQIVQNFPK